MGVAASWNWFLKNIPGIKIICNDDLLFEEHCLEKVIDSYNYNAMVTPISMIANAFSCYTLGENVINHVGYFDEEISPGYGYFEDNDYYRRMTLAGFRLEIAEGCMVTHGGSSTIKKLSQHDRAEHNRKFTLAQANFVKKWGGTPGRERYTRPYDH